MFTALTIAAAGLALGHPSFAVRETAEQMLAKSYAGRWYAEQLVRRTADAEVRVRCERLADPIRQYEWRIWRCPTRGAWAGVWEYTYWIAPPKIKSLDGFDPLIVRLPDEFPKGTPITDQERLREK